MEGGSLFDHLHKYKTKFEDNQLFDISKDMALGLAYLHKMQVLHCDLKSSNILVSSNFMRIIYLIYNI